MRLIEKKQKQKRYLMLIKKQIIEQQINKLHFFKTYKRKPPTWKK